jgi:hypothetical protein
MSAQELRRVELAMTRDELKSSVGVGGCHLPYLFGRELRAQSGHPSPRPWQRLLCFFRILTLPVQNCRDGAAVLAITETGATEIVSHPT